MHLRDVCDQLQALEDLGAKRTAKIEILDRICDDDIGCEILKLIYVYWNDPYRLYHLHLDDVRWSQGNPEVTPQQDERQFYKLLAVLDRCAEGSISGNYAREKVGYRLDQFHPDVAKWMVRMINRNLRIRLSATTFEKCFPGAIKWFGCQLAVGYGGGDLDRPYLAQPKLDGLRGIFILDPTNPHALSRSGKPIHNVDHIIQQLMKCGLSGMVVDGEVMSKATSAAEDDFAASISAARSQSSTGRELWLHAFDMVPQQEFEIGRFTVPQHLRTDGLKVFVEGCKHVIHPHTLEVRTEADVLQAARQFLSQGFEGAVIKHPDALYSLERSVSWQKVKFMQDADCCIVKVWPGGGEFSETMGSVTVVHPNGVETNVGSGYDHATRHWIWENQDAVIGRTMSVQFQNLTPEGKMRFPVHMVIREDK